MSDFFLVSDLSRIMRGDLGLPGVVGPGCAGFGAGEPAVAEPSRSASRAAPQTIDEMMNYPRMTMRALTYFSTSSCIIPLH